MVCSFLSDITWRIPCISSEGVQVGDVAQDGMQSVIASVATNKVLEQ